MEYILFILGFVLLGFGGDFLIKGSIELSLKYKIPRIIIGMTIVALLTSFPEIIVCIKASIKNWVSQLMTKFPFATSASLLWCISLVLNLFSQEERGFQADLYGLCHPLKNNWILFDLGSEALALMASLCAREPGGETDLRSVVASFSVLGLKPSDEEVLLHLTKAGLATGAADADDAVKVKSAF